MVEGAVLEICARSVSFVHTEALDFTGVPKLKFQLFFAFSPAFLSKDFWGKKRVKIHGDVPKWLKGPDSKSCGVSAFAVPERLDI